jgi:hypothetical protein
VRNPKNTTQQSIKDLSVEGVKVVVEYSVLEENYKT